MCLLLRSIRSQADLLAAPLDLELITGLQTQHGGVGLADEQVAVELQLGEQVSSALLVLTIFLT